MRKPLAPAPVAAADRALSILGAFRATDIALSLAELASRTKLNKATLLRLAATLERHGYLARTDAGDFRIGPAPLALATMFQRATQPAEMIMPALERLTAQTGESSAFHVPVDARTRVCLYRVDSFHSVREHLRPGDIAPMQRGAAGRILTLFASRPAAGTELVTVTAGEVTPDVRTAAAPVFSTGGRLAGALSVSGPQYRFTQAAAERAQPHLLAAVRHVTLCLGGDPAIYDVAPAAKGSRSGVRSKRTKGSAS